jgi:SNF2 family DNA or RNA helicase
MDQFPALRDSNLKAFAHQKKALEMSIDRRNFAFFMEMGTGKSKVFIDTALNLYLRGEISAVLLFAPKGVYMNWIDKELPEHWPKDVPCLYTYFSTSPSKELKAEWASLKNFEGLKWLCVNIEALAYATGEKFAHSFAGAYANKFLCGIDESTMIKSPTAKRTLSAIKIGKWAKYKRILTGDPVPRSPTDLYSQCMFLDSSLLGFSSFYAFRNRYCTMREILVAQIGNRPGSRKVSVITGTQRLDELKDVLKKFSYRVVKDDCLDIPAKIYTTYTVELTPEQKKAYSDLKETATLFINDHVVTAALAITQLIRFHQIVMGYVQTDGGELIELPTNRPAALLSVVEQTRGKVVIWATYRHDIKLIIKALKEEYGNESVVDFFGDTSDDDRRKAVNAFQNRPEVRFFVGNPASGRYGITLTSSHDVIYYSNNFNLEFRNQSEDRCHRIGQTSKVTYVDLVTPNTIDVKVINALRNKKNVSALINGDTFKEWL